MPPLDLDTLVSCDGGGELTAACGCDTALSEDGSGAAEEDDDPYAPAQSLRLRIGEDIDWSDVAAAVAVLERDDSTKGAGANPKCAARRSGAAAAGAARGSAPRAVATVVIGGLSGKAAREHGRWRSPRRLGGGGRASRVFAAGEAAAADRLVEPGSPKVSCLGGVRSQPRAAAEGVGSGVHGWWTCLVVGRRERRRPRGSEAN